MAKLSEAPKKTVSDQRQQVRSDLQITLDDLYEGIGWLNHCMNNLEVDLDRLFSSDPDIPAEGPFDKKQWRPGRVKGWSV